MNKNDGGPAFPVAYWDKDQMRFVDSGMSLRDYFAAAALPAANAQELITPTYNGSTYKGTAERAYLMADAMLAERNKVEA